MRPSAQSDCIKQLMKYKRQEGVIDKTLDNFFDNSKFEHEIFKLLKSERYSKMLERRATSNSLRATIEDAKNRLNEIMEIFHEMQRGEKIDLEKFKGKLMCLANKFREFKKSSPLEHLAIEEMDLDKEIREFSLSIGKYNKQSSIKCIKKNTEKATEFPEFTGVENFDSLIAKTGHTQNWSESDHSLFLKLRKNCGNVPSLVAAMRKQCPDLTAERIVNHEAWYKMYMDLREKQKKTIREWREKKKLDKREKSVEILHVEESNGKSVDVETSKKNVSNTRTVGKILKEKKPLVESMGDKRELIKQWRAAREKEINLQLEKSRSELESRRAREENRRLRRAEAVKSAVIAYKEKNMENPTSSSATSSTDLERPNDKSKKINFIKCFRNQDEEFLRRRKALLEKKTSKPIAFSCHKVCMRSGIESPSPEPNSSKIRMDRSWVAQEPQLFCGDYAPQGESCDWNNRKYS